jgi:hypothetical protein
LRDTVKGLGAPDLRKRAPYAHHALCWLAYPEDFTEVPDKLEPRFAPWVDGVGGCIVEALQPELLARTVAVESRKERIDQPAEMRAVGNAQERVYTAFLDAIEKKGRRDLARFMLRAGAQLLGHHAHPGMWTGALQMQGQRLADRAATYQAATVFLRMFERLSGWARWARTQGYFDEEYEPAQLFLADWEQYDGDTLWPRAQAIVRNLDPMRQAAAAVAPA